MSYDDDAFLLQRIEALLRGPSPPPEEVLERVLHTLQRARSHSATSTSHNGPQTAVHDSACDERALAHHSKPHASRGAGHTAPRTTSFARPVWDDPSDVLSLQIGRRNDARRSLPLNTLFNLASPAVCLSEGEARPPQLGVRERKTRELQVSLLLTFYVACSKQSSMFCFTWAAATLRRASLVIQDLMAGVGGKYRHADLDPEGGTQIGGIRTKSKSMVGADYGKKGQLAGIADVLSKGKPAYNQTGPNDFRF